MAPDHLDDYRTGPGSWANGLERLGLERVQDHPPSARCVTCKAVVFVRPPDYYTCPKGCNAEVVGRLTEGYRVLPG